MFRDCAPAQLSLLAGLYNCLFCFIACEPTLKISVDNVWKRCLSHEFQMSCHVSWQWHDCLDRFLSSLDDWTTSTECWWSACRGKQMSNINFSACGLRSYVLFYNLGYINGLARQAIQKDSSTPFKPSPCNCFWFLGLNLTHINRCSRWVIRKRALSRY